MCFRTFKGQVSSLAETLTGEREYAMAQETLTTALYSNVECAKRELSLAQNEKRTLEVGEQCPSFLEIAFERHAVRNM